MEILSSILRGMSDFIWGIPMLVLLFGTHLFMTGRMRLIQRYTFKAIKMSFTAD